ncbi:MAG: autotransporter-associated beta strand repeat-containing protein [Prosthecobacter sp.]|uniref:beta strand repeat-containing protein n=1 Tax=Prosthecobacter sp. TaxID=1965333 RepID=UPI0019F5DEB4|nr:autotransporter-associated beta strand repeat-containing protein [Prosthecobacter sp.]MBE2282485.1 autotransporter-associated beta strand repeat-containing protein [Prosthecobacter sp.]
MMHQPFAASAVLRRVLSSTRTCRRFFCLLLLVCTLASSLSHAAVQTWLDANASNDWSLTAPNWNGNVPWTDGNDAVFGGTGETVEIASDVVAMHLTFNSNGYIIADANNDSLFSLSTGSIITVTSAAHVATISEAIANGDLAKAGAGTLILSGTNTFNGSVSVTAGTLSLANDSALGGASTGTSVTSSGVIELQNGVSIAGESLNLGSAGGDFFGGLRAAANASATWAGAVILDSGGRVGALSGGLLELSGVIQNGTTGSLLISAPGSGASLGTVRISGTANTYTGTTGVIRGRLQLGASNALPTGTVLDLDTTSASEDSIFDLNGFSQTLGGLQRSGGGNGAGGSFVTNNGATAGTLTLNQTTSTTYSGIIQDGAGVVNLVKSGTGTLTLSGDNTYGGATSVTGGILVMSGNNTLSGNITVGAGLTLTGANTLADTLAFQVNSGGFVTVGNDAAVGSSGGLTVSSGGRVVLQSGIQVAGKTLTLSGTGGNNSGALQTASSATATWSGNIVTAAGDTRIGGGEGGTLIVNGVISGTGGMLYSRANNATTILNAVSTYTGDTQLFANGGSGGRLVIGVDNALSGTSKLSVFLAVTATVAITVDLNGHTSAFTGLDTANNHATGLVLSVLNNGSAASTLTLSGTSLGSNELVFNGRLNDGTSSMALVKNGSFTQTFVAANGYTGDTILNAGTIQIGKTSVTGFTGSNGSLASGNLLLNGGTLALDNLGTGNNGSNRLADSASVSFRGGSMIYRGSDLASSSETIGSIIAHSKRSTLTLTYGGTNAATLTAGSFSRVASGGLLFVNGVNLGLDSTSTASLSRLVFTSAPDLAGTTPAAATGLGTVKNLQIVPGMYGEAGASSGGVGTATGTANTFLTYHAATGLRPLNPVDEFTQNSFASGDNVRITSATTLSASTSVNSLIFAGAGGTIGSGKTLTVASGMILFASGNSLTFGGGGTLAFGNREGVIIINSGANTTFSSVMTGTAGVSYYGTGTMVTNQQHLYSGPTGLFLGSSIVQVSSIGTPGAVVSGPYGTGTLILGGASTRASTAGHITLHNNVEFRADTTITSGSVDKTLTFAGAVDLSSGSRTLTNSSTANTYFTGVISETAVGSGITIAGSGASAVVFSGNNTYTGATVLSGSTTLLINGDQSAATGAVTVSSGTLGGTGTLGGATTIQTGGTLSPGDPAVAAGLGTLTFGSGLVLKSGSGATLQITGATFTSSDGFGGQFPGTPGYEAYVIANGGGSGGTLHDQLSITGAFTQETGAKITVQPVSFTPVAGQIFNLLDWTEVVGGTFSSNLGPTLRDGSSDSTFDLDLPDILASGYAWDISLFASHGIIVVVPEPTRCLLLLLGFGGLIFRRRR